MTLDDCIQNAKDLLSDYFNDGDPLSPNGFLDGTATVFGQAIWSAFKNGRQAGLLEAKQECHLQATSYAQLEWSGEERACEECVERINALAAQPAPEKEGETMYSEDQIASAAAQVRHMLAGKLSRELTARERQNELELFDSIMLALFTALGASVSAQPVPEKEQP